MHSRTRTAQILEYSLLRLDKFGVAVAAYGRLPAYHGVEHTYNGIQSSTPLSTPSF
ncbi:hypothetical protein PAHAL_5G267000 [Panicum hallii]|uniref:Uncharacterized protein n=1 Tax=Panicum hallii TaxID=206008 RepID=A0A2T8ILB5_9POAL|nr:hypothetical protein PAHAL_5G267000 [Panicum hallii]